MAATRKDNAAPVADAPVVLMPGSVVVVCVLGLAAAWLAAGSTGMLAVPLRHVLAWLALSAALVVVLLGRRYGTSALLLLAVAVVAGLALTPTANAAVNTLAVVVVLAALAGIEQGPSRGALWTAALAAAVLAVFRFAMTSVPLVWQLADQLGYTLGRAAGALTGQPLWIGATFAGVDFLVVMAAIYAMWLWQSPPPWLKRGIGAAAAIVAVHFLYLAALAYSEKFREFLPPPPAMPQVENSLVGAWSWSNAARGFLPWQVPLLALVGHTLAAAWLLRSLTFPNAAEPAEAAPSSSPPSRRNQRSAPAQPAAAGGDLWKWAVVGLAVALPVAGLGVAERSGLKGKTVLAYEHGYMNWSRPEYDQPETTVSAHGMLPALVESLGGRFVRSAKLSQEDLGRANVLLLIHPDRAWAEGDVERIKKFVADGGSLLFAAEPRVCEGDSQSNFEDVLDAVGIEVRYDAAFPAAAQWEHCFEPLAHPATMLRARRPGAFSMYGGASLRLGWRANPVLVGRFGHSEPGSDSARTARSRYAAGEKLGDLVLAAEQRYGAGRICVLGSTTPLTNDGLVQSHEFVGRLLGWLADPAGGPQAWWRQLLTLAAAVGLIGALAIRPRPGWLAVAAVVMAASVGGAEFWGRHASRAVPDGARPDGTNRLAYIDASHLAPVSDSPWSNYGLAYVARAFMRNGYLPLMLDEFSHERLDKAGVLLEIAPARAFSPAEIEIARAFVESGGALFWMVGAEEIAPSRGALAEFGMDVPHSPVGPNDFAREPLPLGSSNFGKPADDAPIPQFFSAWPVDGGSGSAQLHIWGGNYTEMLGKPEEKVTIAFKQVGSGAIVLIGDTYFAVNLNMWQAPTTEDTAPAPGKLGSNDRLWKWLLEQSVGRKTSGGPDPSRNRPPSDRSPPPIEFDEGGPL